MEKLTEARKRAFILAALFLAFGAVIQASPKLKLNARTEQWMESQAPLKVGKYVFSPNQAAKNPNQSYVTDDRTYEELKPFGIVGRVYESGMTRFDVLLIAGNDKNSFHDNRVCFSSQGYTITKQENLSVDTVRGKIPITLLTMNHMARGSMRAAMFYKGPGQKFFPLPKDLTWAMFIEQLKLGTDMESVFYRIIPLHSDATDEQLIEFVKLYVAAAQESSKGYF